MAPAYSSENPCQKFFARDREKGDRGEREVAAWSLECAWKPANSKRFRSEDFEKPLYSLSVSPNLQTCTIDRRGCPPLEIPLKPPPRSN